MEAICLLLCLGAVVTGNQPSHKYFTMEVKSITEIKEHYQIAFDKEIKLNGEKVRFVLFTSKDEADDLSDRPPGYQSKPYAFALIKQRNLLVMKPIEFGPKAGMLNCRNYQECKFDIETHHLDDNNVLLKLTQYDKTFGTGQYREWRILLYQLSASEYSLEKLLDFYDESTGSSAEAYSQKTYFTIKDIDRDGNIEMKIIREEYVDHPLSWPEGESNTLKEIEWLYRWNGEQFIKLKEDTKESKELVRAAMIRSAP